MILESASSEQTIDLKDGRRTDYDNDRRSVTVPVAAATVVSCHPLHFGRCDGIPKPRRHCSFSNRSQTQLKKNNLVLSVLGFALHSNCAQHTRSRQLSTCQRKAEELWGDCISHFSSMEDAVEFPVAKRQRRENGQSPLDHKARTSSRLFSPFRVCTYYVF